MITVRDALAVLVDAKKVALEWGGELHEINPADSFMLACIGSIIVTKITPGFREGDYELSVAMQPVRAE